MSPSEPTEVPTPSPCTSPPPEARSVYGPVHSWRWGRSLGIDLLLRSSICSFQCIYCQLGKIQVQTTEHGIFVPTEKIRKDLEGVRWDEVDVVTFSGSGEPTLALNLGEAIALVKSLAAKPVMILSNATLFRDAATRRRVLEADRISCKLDAAGQEMLKRINRPASGVRFEDIIEGIRLLRKDYRGILSLQCMFLPMNRNEAEGIAHLAATLGPDEIHINTPRRPHPEQWTLESRGAHTPSHPPLEGAALQCLETGQLEEIEQLMRKWVPGAHILSARNRPPA